MPEVDPHQKQHQEYSEILLNEAKPFMTGQPRVWGRRFGEAVTAGEIFGKVMKSHVPFSKSGMRIDVIVINDIPTAQGMLHAVQDFSGKVILPTEFLIVIDGQIPHAVCLKKGGFLSSPFWVTDMSQTKSMDDFCNHLNKFEWGKGMGNRAFSDFAVWTHSLSSKTKLELSYTQQLIPISGSQFVLMFHKPWASGLWSVKQMKFHVKDALDLAEGFKQAVIAYKYNGPAAELQILEPRLSIVAVPELAQHLTNCGEELGWSA